MEQNKNIIFQSYTADLVFENILQKLQYLAIYRIGLW